MHDRATLVLLRHYLDLGMAKTSIAALLGIHPRTISHRAAGSGGGRPRLADVFPNRDQPKGAGPPLPQAC